MSTVTAIRQCISLTNQASAASKNELDITLSYEAHRVVSQKRSPLRPRKWRPPATETTRAAGPSGPRLPSRSTAPQEAEDHGSGPTSSVRPEASLRGSLREAQRQPREGDGGKADRRHRSPYQDQEG